MKPSSATNAGRHRHRVVTVTAALLHIHASGGYFGEFHVSLSECFEEILSDQPLGERPVTQLGKSDTPSYRV